MGIKCIQIRDKWIFRAFLIISVSALLVSCAGPSFRGDKKVISASSGSAPDWVKDSERYDQKHLKKLFDDNSDSPKYYYLVSQAHVDDDSLVPSCYNFARANAANELASSINQEVNGTVSSSSDTSGDSHYSITTVQTRAALTGSEILDRYWEKTQDKDQTEQVICYLITAIPMKNYSELKKIAMRKSGKSDMDQAVQKDAEKTHETGSVSGGK